MENLTPYTDHLSFNSEENDMETDEEYAEFQKLIVKEIILPSFYTFKPPTNVYEINVDSSGPMILITVADSDGNPEGGTFSDLEQAYDFVSNTLKGDVKFTGDIKAITGEEDNFFVSVKSKNNPKYSRLLMARTDEDEEFFAKSTYYTFLKMSNEYVNDPNDFEKAFHWLDAHPAFWSRYKADSFDWEINNNEKIGLGVMNRNGKTVIMLETGAAVEPERTTRYHDLRLDSDAATYEEAIIKLAARVHKFYDVDGTERKNVIYQKSKFELELEAVLKKVEEDYPSEKKTED